MHVHTCIWNTHIHKKMHIYMWTCMCVHTCLLINEFMLSMHNLYTQVRVCILCMHNLTCMYGHERTWHACMQVHAWYACIHISAHVFTHMIMQAVTCMPALVIDADACMNVMYKYACVTCMHNMHVCSTMIIHPCILFLPRFFMMIIVLRVDSVPNEHMLYRQKWTVWL